MEAKPVISQLTSLTIQHLFIIARVTGHSSRPYQVLVNHNPGAFGRYDERGCQE